MRVMAAGVSIANIGLRSLMSLVCFVAISGHVKPVITSAEEEPISVKDAIQDHDIAALNEHMRSTDATVEQHRIQINTNSLAIAEGQGEARASFFILGLLSTVSIVIQVRGKKSA